MSIDVMKQALEALHTARPACFADNTLEAVDNAITALRAAIEQAQRHNGWALREVLFDEGIAIGHREPQHKPLTDEEIEAIRVDEEFDQWGISEAAFKYVARAIEAAHGIGEKK